MKDRNIYILVIRDCISRIRKYTKDYDKNSFLKDFKTQDATIRNIEIIGQAVKDYGIEDLLNDYPDVPWQQVAGMRNIIAHEYLGIDMEITWEVINVHLNLMEQHIIEMASTIE